MTLVERFIQFNSWPTSRKVASILGAVLPLHLLAWPAAHFAFLPTHLIDVAMLDRFQGAWCALVAATSLVSTLAWRAGKQAPWTAYLLLPYLAFVVWLIHLFGSGSTVLAAILPVLILSWTYLLPEREAWVALLFGLGAYALVAVLEFCGVLPYAPILLERSVDAQLNVAWFVVGAYAVFSYLLFNFALSLFAMRTRALQETRLNHAQGLIRRYVPTQVVEQIVSGRFGIVDRH
jgi:adenylate cyclase